MLKKILWLLLFSILTLFANEGKTVTTDKFQIFAKSVENETDKMVATGNVLLTTPKYYIMAEELVYFKDSEIAEAFGNVVVIQNGTSQMISEYAYFDMKNDMTMINPIFFLDYTNNLWINSKTVDSGPTEDNFDTSTISSCNCIDPAWSMRVSSGTRDNENQWMHLFNMRLYVGRVPVFYTPYFGYPTDNTRRSGLLNPTMGISNEEGFLYAQPIYFAPADNWDLEFVPQNRVKRGSGLYTTFRYADSRYSTFLLKTGVFKEEETYQNKYSIENEKHHGFNIKYDRSNIFESGTSNDELALWLDWMNDVEYRNLDNDNISSTGDSTSYGTNRESYINYYYDTSKWYNGIYFKYYLNTSIDDNDVTLQQLPQYQSHIYTDSIIFDKLTYSTDLLYTNYFREDGITAQKTDFNIPLSYEFSFFDDYLFFKLKEDLTVSNIKYGLEEDQNYEDGNYIKSNHQISLSTDLIKPYKDIAHSINLGIDYTVPEVYEKSGDLHGVTSSDGTLSSFTFTESAKSLALSAKQYFYDIKTKKLLLSDFLTQSYEYKNEKYVATNLENQLTINYDLGTISNRMIYNQEDEEVILSSSSFSIAKDWASLTTTHYSSKPTTNTSYGNSESMTLSASVKPTKRVTLTYENNYNLLNDESSKESYILDYDEKCWSINLKLEDSLITSSSTTSSAVRQDILYVSFELKPLGGYQFKQKFDERTE